MSDCKEVLSGEDSAPALDMATCMDKFARTFEASARRWELVVYPSMLAFIVLAAYGFFLIYSLSHDISRLARSMETVVVSMNDVSANMTALSGNVALMSGNMAVIAHEVGDESGTMKNMLVKMDTMNQSMGVIALPMYQMRDDMGRMSKNMNNVAGPMSIVNGVAPW